MESVSAVT